MPPTLLALWVLRRDGAEWFAVPAAWPATQFYYVAMALPALVRRPLLAALLALCRAAPDAARGDGDWPSSRCGAGPGRARTQTDGVLTG